MPHSIFIETAIPSDYGSRPSRNLLQFARQELTREWWDARRHEFDLFTSQLVLDEASEGEPAKASERLQLVSELAKRFNYDVAAIARDARARQASSGHKVVNRSTGA